MSPDSANNDLNRVRQLTVERCTGALTEDQTAELSELLADSPQAREEYWQTLLLHAQLDWDLGGRGSADDAVTRQIASLTELASPSSTGPASGTPAGWWFALAASLLVAVLGGSIAWQGLGPTSPPSRLAEDDTPAESIVGQLASLTPDSSWSFGRTGAKDASSFRRGDTIYLESGAAELRLTSGTVASLEAPVIMQAVSVDRVRLISGGIKVEVAQGAEGFAVETNTAEVIDLGTVFSVGVENGAVDLIVFDGEVDLNVPAGGDDQQAAAAGVTKRFRAGEAVQVARDGTLSRIVNVQQSDYTGETDALAAGPVVAEVRDNNNRADMWSFYEIVPGGMREDAKAFVDRPHEWNGLHSAGMPEYLVGGDYVKTFNDDKVVDALSIEVTLARPATLYVLLDHRVTPPEWLRGSFERTGDQIGVDEVSFKPESPSDFSPDDLRMGAGQSINRTHSVWKRVIPNGGVVSLGANGEMDDAPPEGVHSKANMYGLVAVPLRQGI